MQLKLQSRNEHLSCSQYSYRIKLQSLKEVITLNDLTCKHANTQIGQGDVINELVWWSLQIQETVVKFSGALTLTRSIGNQINIYSLIATKTTSTPPPFSWLYLRTWLWCEKAPLPLSWKYLRTNIMAWTRE